MFTELVNALALLFGGIAAISIFSPVLEMQGAIFDVRSVVLSMAGLFGGPVVAAIAAAMAGAARLWIGGAGTAVGLGTIALATLLGLAYRHAHERGHLDIRLVPLLAFGLLLHTLLLALAQLLPGGLAQQMNQTLTLPLFLLSLPTTALVGLLLRDVQDRMATEHALADRVSVWFICC